MKRSDQISAIFWLLLSIFVCFKSFDYRLMEKAEHVLGPGFVPFLIGVVMGILSIGLLIKSCRSGNDKKENISFNFENFKDIVLLVGGLLAFAFLLNTLGFILSMSILMAFLFRGEVKKGKVKKWLIPICLGLLVSLISYFIFSYLLEIPLPKGFLEV